MPNQTILPEVIAQIMAVDRVYVRMTLTRGDSGRLRVRSLLVDVLPQVWLDNRDNILSDWLSTPFRYEYDGVGAVLLSEAVSSERVGAWFRGEACQLDDFDMRRSFGAHPLDFDMPEMHEQVGTQRCFSYRNDTFISMPWPHTVYRFMRKDPTNYYRSEDFEPLVAPDAEYFTNFSEGNAEVIHGISDPTKISNFEDEVVVRVVHADAWLNEVRIGQSELTAMVYGLRVFGSQIVLSGSPEVRQRRDVLAVGAVTLPIPHQLPPRLIIALTHGTQELDQVVYAPTLPMATLYSSSARQVVVEREIGAEEPDFAAMFSDRTPDLDLDWRNEEISESGILSEDATTDITNGSPGMTHPKVFISYSHDTGQHARRVLNLADKLRQDGVDCSIDAYEDDPEQGWPQWMKDRIDWAEFVLVVCTQIYNRRFCGKEEPGTGLGATWEGAILTQKLYNQAAKNSSIIPIVFSPEDIAHIPTILQGATRYKVSDGPEYTKLYRRLTNQPNIIKPPLGSIKHLPPGNDEVQ